MRTVDKSILRNQMITSLKNISKIKKSTIENALFHQLTNSILWQDAKTIGLTVSHSFEWDTSEIMKRAWKDGKRIVLPKCHVKTRQMTFYEITSFDDLKEGYAHIMEPIVSKTYARQKNEIDLLLVPGIVFDSLGYRIGFGGGFYDRFLVDFTGVTASLVSKIQQVDQISVEPFDIPVQYMITEESVIQLVE